MKNYGFDNVINFILDNNFVRWVDNFCPKENAFWHYCLEYNFDDLPVMDEAKDLLETIKIKPIELTEHFIDNEISKLLLLIK